MMPVSLIADSGATKAEWCLLHNGRKKNLFTQGISPYFLSTDQIADLLRNELVGELKKYHIENIFYYGTGCSNPTNVKSIQKALRAVFPESKAEVQTDLMAAA